MRKAFAVITFVAIGFCFYSMAGCSGSSSSDGAAGSGGAGSSGAAGTGTAGVAGGATTTNISMQLLNHSGTTVQTHNGYTLTFSGFQMNLKQVQIGSFTTTTDFSAEIASAKDSDILVVTNVPTGVGFSSIQFLLHTAVISGTAVSGSSTCQFSINLGTGVTSVGFFNVGSDSNTYTQASSGSNELLVDVHPDLLFADFNMPTTCTGGIDLAVSNDLTAPLKTKIITTGVTELH